MIPLNNIMGDIGAGKQANQSVPHHYRVSSNESSHNDDQEDPREEHKLSTNGVPISPLQASAHSNDDSGNYQPPFNAGPGSPPLQTEYRSNFSSVNAVKGKGKRRAFLKQVQNSHLFQS